MPARTKKITTCLAFDASAEEAARFYVSIFADSRIIEITHCVTTSRAGPGAACEP
jgi:predicted 3-demethylubiquinone-9 3-methyltransferase (glyoxalase superfamily)